MVRILFLVLCVFPVLGPQAQGAIEIYANGHKYDSLQAYLASKTSKVKAPQVNQKKLSGSTALTTGDIDLHKFYILSVENGVAGALQDFYETRGQPDFQMTRRISSEQLQEAIAQAVTTSKDPKLLISKPGKVRIMVLKK